MELLPVLAMMAGWEALARVAQFALRRLPPSVIVKSAEAKPAKLSPREKLVRIGPSYAVAFVHAVLTAVRGSMHVVALLRAPPAAQLAIPAAHDDAWYAAAEATTSTNLLFFSYLAYDLVHVIADYPLQGGVDTIAHHAGFMAASLVCGLHRILPFPFGWLLVGEVSSIPLDIRWFLLTTGRTSSRTNVAFASTFFLCRVCVYGAGLVHLYLHRDLLLALGTTHVPPPLLTLVLVLLVGGYALNLLWFRKILQMALK